MADTIQSCFPDTYDIIKKIGRGGTADIYLARMRGNARPVVLKRFFDQSASALIDSEQHIATRMNFPGIVRVHGTGRTTDNALFLRMEYCEGPTLEVLTGRVSEKKLLAILSSVTASLNVLHQAGIVHKDLKPSNIFCPIGFDRDNFPVESLFYLKLADFSLAGDYSTETGDIVMGTVGYMSPEIIQKREISPSSDLFSLGVMAYQLACGRLPFTSPTNDPLEINAQVTEGARPPLCDSGSTFSRGLSDLISSLLEINPSRRPSSAFSLLETLSRLGSPYPYRIAIRPRHLLFGIDNVDEQTLIDLFGEGSFSIQQQRQIKRMTGYEPAGVRILLEDNFDRGNFARRDGRWGWKSEKAEIIEWTRRQGRFGLRPLKGSSVTVKKLALGLAVLGDCSLVEKVTASFDTDETLLRAAWQKIPEICRPALLYSLDQRMKPETRKIVSARMAGFFQKSDEHQALAGRLLFHAEQYREAVAFLNQSIEKRSGTSEHDVTFELIDLLVQASQHLNDHSLQASGLLKRARLERDVGMLPESENTYLQVMSLLEEKGDDGLLAQTYKELGNLYKAKTDYRSGIEIFHRAQELYLKMGDQLGLSHIYNGLGNIYWISGDLDRALRQYQKALKIQKELKSEKEIATSLNNIGNMYVIKGQYENGIAYYHESLELRKKLGDKAQMAQTWNNLGATYFMLGDAVKALEPFGRAFKINREIGTRDDLLFNIENLAEAMIQAGRLNDALGYLREGTDLAEKLGDISHQSTVNRLTGQLLRRMGYYDEAEGKLNNGLKFARQINNKALTLLCLIDLARLYQQLREFDSAMEAINEAKELAAQLGDKSALSHTALIELALTGRREKNARGEDMLQCLDTERDRALLYLTLLEHNIRQGITKESTEYLQNTKKFFSGNVEDIEIARSRLAFGRFHMLTGDIDQARVDIKRSMELADKLNLLPEQWQANSAFSELMFKKKDFESSFKYARRATAILKKIAEHIADSDRLGRFYNYGRITDLLGRIKSLKAVLGKKKGAAVGSP